ncbi:MULTISPECIES: ribonuclease P protein component [Micromonospora]|uniref:Ribonuclease P protein component n=1 Tax=Micromonospora chalcea TaxID=1874 RepID=A0ABX9Y398_MICCH|nr:MULTISPECIES: ribonuclease P protein component [Micromonospora]EWM66802.1 ribonuclease P protein component [Micromonospora sp. M42]MBC8994140.1 ribonuclease P protein component [Micromonospora chalcea]MBQ1060703.1 ribonuclease P protein component [Micromonospora sp. C41]MBQ1065762.1 ribonuclease P protein component [Micromonospora sp. D75]MCK1805967.1 ribonuclease P protein component [Micromonospora sp. R42106]
MLAAAQRLRRSSDFAAAVRGGRRVGRGAVVVHLTIPEPIGTTATPSPEPARTSGAETSAPSRAGFVVSKAVGGAVVRNKVRRRLRHLVRERLAELPAGTTLVVRALPAAADATYTRLGADLDAALAAARSPRGRRSR